jgi:hypothetical protein
MGLSACELFDEAIQKSQVWLNELREVFEWDQPGSTRLVPQGGRWRWGQTFDPRSIPNTP